MIYIATERLMIASQWPCLLGEILGPGGGGGGFHVARSRRRDLVVGTGGRSRRASAACVAAGLARRLHEGHQGAL